MEVIVRETREAAVVLTARLVSDAVRANPGLVLGLATGRTMEAVYAHLLSLDQAEPLDFSEVTTFNLDEYIGLPRENPHSYNAYMRRHLFDHVNIDPAKTHLPDGCAQDIEEECARYEAAITAAGGIDIQLLGIGVSGHIGFNEPISALRSRTRPKGLTPTTVAQNQHLFDRPEDMPLRAITMGVGTILESGWAILLATGADKADIIAKAVEGPVTGMVTASALQMHPHCTVIVDGEAASGLTQTEYYRWLFENEPEWAPYRD